MSSKQHQGSVTHKTHQFEVVNRKPMSFANVKKKKTLEQSLFTVEQVGTQNKETLQTLGTHLPLESIYESDQQSLNINSGKSKSMASLPDHKKPTQRRLGATHINP